MKTIAQYDIGEYINGEIEYYQQNKDEYLEYRGDFNDDERKVEDISDDEIEQDLWEDEYIGERHWEDFEQDLWGEFAEQIGKNVFVIGKNMTWRNLSGEKTFTINDPIDMFREIVPECDLTYKMEKVKKGEYEVRIAHHDSPMGEHYNIKIK